MEEYEGPGCPECGSKLFLHTEQKGWKNGVLLCVNSPDCKGKVIIPSPNPDTGKLLKRIAVFIMAITIISLIWWQSELQLQRKEAYWEGKLEGSEIGFSAGCQWTNEVGGWNSKEYCEKEWETHFGNQSAPDFR